VLGARHTADTAALRFAARAAKGFLEAAFVWLELPLAFRTDLGTGAVVLASAAFSKVHGVAEWPSGGPADLADPFGPSDLFPFPHSVMCHVVTSH
jgi:hypothetical protein